MVDFETALYEKSRTDSQLTSTSKALKDLDFDFEFLDLCQIKISDKLQM